MFSQTDRFNEEVTAAFRDRRSFTLSCHWPGSHG